MKPANQTTHEHSLTEFDKKMIQEMKKIPELQKWTDQQFSEYCSILKCYSMMIITSAMNEIHSTQNSSGLTLTSTQFKQAA
jgi:hypothetical protein